VTSSGESEDVGAERPLWLGSEQVHHLFETYMGK